MNEWVGHTDWWLSEIENDPIYRLDVLPLVEKLLGKPDGVMLDLGCGEGQVMRERTGTVIGCDVSSDLLASAHTAGPVVRSELPSLDWLRPGSIDAAYMVLVLEHLADLHIFETAARVIGDGGALVVVMNHPAFTAAGAGPILDPTDGEVLWRWGSYFDAQACPMATGDGEVTFFHRPLADILNAAAAAGWMLDEVIETGFSQAALATQPGYVGQEQLPRLLGARWMNTQGSRPSRR